MINKTTMIRIVAGCWVAAIPMICLGASDKTQAWIDLIHSDASLQEKARACQRLGEFGAAEAVPALASLLNHDKLAVYARAGLERIPGSAPRSALRMALGETQGKHLQGVIHSIAALRDDQAVTALSRLMENPDPDVSRAALVALGRISTDEAVALVLEALTKDTVELRSNAAGACLLAAEHQLSLGKPARALAVYEAVRNADVPLSYRIGATRSAILNQENDSDFLIQQLRSKESAIRNVAVLTARQNPSDSFAAVLNNEIGNVSGDLQLQLIDALTDCHNAQSKPIIRKLVGSADAQVRLTALNVLRQIGDPGSVPVLLRVLQKNRGTEEVSMAVNTLEPIQGDGIDELILTTLSSEQTSEVRIILIRLLEARVVTRAASVLLAQAADPDQAVCLAAVQALGSLASFDELPRLIQLTRECTDSKIKDAAANAVYAVCRNKEQGDHSARLILEELTKASLVSDKTVWIRVLALLGYAEALPTITAVLSETNKTLAQSTISSLGRWPGPLPINALFDFAEGDSPISLRTHALMVALRLATAAGEREQATEGLQMVWFQRASKAVQSVEEKRLLISGLGRIKQRASIELLAAYLDDTDVKMEAVHAIVNAAAPLVKGPDYQVVETVLAKISGVEDTRLMSQIEALKRDIKATSAQADGSDTDQMIQKHRMGELIIQTKPGAQVRVEQIRHEFWFGAAISSSAFGGRYDAQTQQKYKEVFLSNFNAAVTENALKWHAMESRRGQVDYSIVDAMLDWTEKNEIPLRGHNIFWGISGRVQNWLKDLDDKALREALKLRATTIARRYKGRFAEYDLNNEMIHGNYYADRLGPGITKEMTTWIKKIDPEAKLFLNDYDILTGNRLNDYVKHIRGLVDEQASIDGVGVQGHLHGDSFDPAKLRHALETLSKEGLPLCITEFNLPGQRSSVYQRRDIKLTPEQEQTKAKAFTEYYRICFAHPAVKGILMWGFWERANWIPQSSLYGADWTPTPAAKAYRELVFNEWWTQRESTANNEGLCRIPAFFGKHRVMVDGSEKIVTLKKSEGVSRVSFR